MDGEVSIASSSLTPANGQSLYSVVHMAVVKTEVASALMDILARTVNGRQIIVCGPPQLTVSASWYQFVGAAIPSTTDSSLDTDLRMPLALHRWCTWRVPTRSLRVRGRLDRGSMHAATGTAATLGESPSSSAAAWRWREAADTRSVGVA